ncbi:MAG TPA: tRNA (adenosine(37)-N6)-dimethylallyltransferase MiaA [Steroidobacteraceae bacterium]|nr:tRNA (adenosine(37)-N6)-dimethylallyltransferase MiaA [Steroidobacteraceae bacterium]
MNRGARRTALVLTGPTGSGKSDWALRLAEQVPIEIVSVDSAQVFRGMDIGTAKPSAAIRARVPHHLIDIRDPAERYSAGEFARDARAAIAAIQQRGRVPVLVGGTLLYLRALLRGMAELPERSPPLRAEIAARAVQVGWAQLHAELALIDPRAAAKIHRNDPQRIQRALEVYRLTGRPISEWQAATPAPDGGVHWLRFALIPSDRAAQLRALEQRLAAMLDAGLLAEVMALYGRGDLHAELPSIRAVGYRQLWAHCAGRTTLPEATRQALVATGQLAKRQLSWLRGDSSFEPLDPAADSGFERILAALRTPAFMAGAPPGC